MGKSKSSKLKAPPSTRITRSKGFASGVSLENLPAEITVNIMHYLREISSLFSLVKASPKHRQVYKRYRDSILTSVVVNDLVARSIHLTHKMDFIEICLSEPLPEDHKLPALIEKFENVYKTTTGYIAHPVLESALRKLNKQALSNLPLVLSVSECEVLSRIERAQAWYYNPSTYYLVSKELYPVGGEKHRCHFTAGPLACYYNPRHIFYAVKFGDHRKDKSLYWGQRIWPEKRLPFLKEAIEEAESRQKPKEEMAVGKGIQQKGKEDAQAGRSER